MTWTRAQIATHCGSCARLIAVGDPVLEIRAGRVKRALKRCESCVGDAPPDLPPIIERHATTTRMEPVATVAARTMRTPPDFKQRQTGEDDE